MPARTVLPPYPNGWYTFALARELPPGGLLARPFLGQEVVVWRARSGAICAADAYCPHLGAHFGHGGRVEGDALRCPFHGFCFDASGACVRTGYGTPPPPTARLRVWPLREANGLLLIYHDAEGRAPTWEVPALEMEGWTPPIYHNYTLADHPQETTENSVDVGHFAFVHHYRDVRALRDLITDGPHLSTAYAAKRPLLPALRRILPNALLDVKFETQIYGLGYSLVEVGVPLLDLHVRMWVLPTPIDTERLVLRLGVSMRVLEPERFHHVGRVLPRASISRLAARAILSSLSHDAQQDFDIWQHKRYIQPPALARGDGPIGKYRVWARQFYDGATESGA